MPPEIIALTRQVRALWHQFDWLPEWAVIGLVLLVFVGGGLLAHRIGIGHAHRAAGVRRVLSHHPPDRLAHFRPPSRATP